MMIEDCKRCVVDNCPARQFGGRLCSCKCHSSLGIPETGKDVILFELCPITGKLVETKKRKKRNGNVKTNCAQYGRPLHKKPR